MNPIEKLQPQEGDEQNSGENQLTLRLLEMLKQTNYELVQENGQRRLTAPELLRGEKERTKGAEIFLGRLPRDCYEDELMPLLQHIGRLLELRLMLDFSGSTRGYAFALFEDAKTARNACTQLNGYEIRSGHRMGVVKSVDNCRLFFGGVPKNKNKQEFLDELNKILEGITDVYLYPSAHDKTLNRGFIFVEFKDHRAAAMARRRLIPGKVTLWNHEIAVDWADPEPGDPIDDDIMETVTALFVRNLSLEVTQQKVKEVFQKTTKVPILKLKKINHFAFVHYENRQAAEHVLRIMTQPDSVAVNEGWEIRWAKPIGATKLLERQRCINEAVAKSGNDKYIEKMSAPNKSTRKRNSKKSDKSEPAIANTQEISTTTHMEILDRFVRMKLNGLCSFECNFIGKEQGYVCKIAVHKGPKVFFEYQGEIIPSKHRAITSACANVYQHLSSYLISNARQVLSQNCGKEKLAMNASVRSPIYWQK